MTKINKLSLVILMSFSLSNTSFAVEAAKPNIALNISNIIYHTANIPATLYRHKETIGELLKGDIINPNSGFIGGIFGLGASLANGKISKVIKLSSDLGKEVTSIIDNAAQIRNISEESLPGAFINTIYNIPNEVVKATNNILEKTADTVVERSSNYKEAKETIAKNKKEIEQDKKQIEIIGKNNQGLQKEVKNITQKVNNYGVEINQVKEKTKLVEKSTRDVLENVRGTQQLLSTNTNQIIQSTNLIRNNTNEINHIKTDLNNRYNQVNNKVKHNRNTSSRGIASVAAMSNIPLPAIVGKTTVGIGMGHYDQKTALAAGVGRYYENGTAMKLSVGLAGSQLSVGGGVSYSF
ncbi:YadA-like family protein [Phocoenobacter atlanticus]|uniref:YadA-like family protein n=1 Tax=Phocoenobacter atlanticus TaxID=3416742 RepID=UPI00277604D6|nr:YadA-like family protein [Pasteurella atlantica]MDP8100306.1 YadA-like family protein [Pasteurella atlantica]